MPLEDLTGTKYIADLNPSWPLGGEPPNDGDNHIRGIKNVLQTQFPNLGSVAVSLTAGQINRGSVPVGTQALFYQASAPAGWSRTQSLSTTYGVLIQPTASAGGGGAGSDDPVLNNKVPSHTHYFSDTTSTNGGSHSHSASAATSGSHSHSVPVREETVSDGGGATVLHFGTIEQIGTSASGAHSHSISVSSASVNHNHTVYGYTNANGSASNWAPRHLKMILCTRDAL